MEVHLIAQGKLDMPALVGLPGPIIDLTNIENMIFCVVEGGMMNGQPSVLICVTASDGSYCIQTSLDKLMTATASLTTMAKERWGWEREDGGYTLMPMSSEARKHILEQIKKELEEWDDNTA